MVLLGTASMLGGITLSCLVPLLGLGADQVNKCNKKYCRFKAYHIDEFRETYANNLFCSLDWYQYSKVHSILLYIPPSSRHNVSEY